MLVNTQVYSSSIHTTQKRQIAKTEKRSSKKENLVGELGWTPDTSVEQSHRQMTQKLNSQQKVTGTKIN